MVNFYYFLSFDCCSLSNLRSFFCFLVSFTGVYSVEATSELSWNPKDLASWAFICLLLCALGLAWSTCSVSFTKAVSSTFSLLSYSFLFLFLAYLSYCFAYFVSSSVGTSCEVLFSVSIFSSISETYSLLIFFISVSNLCSDFPGEVDVSSIFLVDFRGDRYIICSPALLDSTCASVSSCSASLSFSFRLALYRFISSFCASLCPLRSL